MTLTAVPKGLGSNSGDDMDICKCIVPLRYGGTINSRQAASPLGRLVEGKKRWEASVHSEDVLPKNWNGTEQNRTVPVWCSKIRITTDIQIKHLTTMGFFLP
ncbi:uncharacterized protein TNCV_3018231 [Trichonephila clavipes]|nr:uncharacterized protein TNCV_3018231 [Trichonephila clavipes]